MAAELNYGATWDGMVTFLDEHAELADFKGQSPKPLRIVRGPRTNKWVESFAPCIVVDLLRDEQGDEPSQANVHRYTVYFQLTIVGAGATPEDADDMALRINDAVRQAFKGAGRYFGLRAPAGKVLGSNMLSSGWDLAERSNACLAVWVHNRSVQVGT